MNVLIANDIINMEPGRELDELVAEKVMGWKVDKRPGLHDFCCSVFKPNDLTEMWIMNAVYFSPSSNITDAWEVIEKLKHKLEIFSYFHNEDGFDDGWLVKINGRHVGGMKSAQEAICKAALLAALN
jgi:hypothetical protein